MQPIVRDRFYSRREDCIETQLHHLSQQPLGCGRAVDGSAAERANTKDNGPGHGRDTTATADGTGRDTTADGARPVSVRTD
jgi:hypothetical protein